MEYRNETTDFKIVVSILFEFYCLQIHVKIEYFDVIALFIK